MPSSSPSAGRGARSALLSLLLAACTVPARPDDVFEPNDDSSTATRLEPGPARALRANQGDADVFFLEAEAGQEWTFVLVSFGLEDCASLRLTGPGERVLFADSLEDCLRQDPQVQAQGVRFEALPQPPPMGSYELSFVVPETGRYELTVLEQPMPGHIHASWDYSVRVRQETAASGG